MKLYKPSVKQQFSHNAIVINLWGEPWIAEALTWGVRIWSISQSGYLTNIQTLILRHKQGFSDAQIKSMSQKMVSLGGMRYQYENLPQWIVKILLHIDIFNRKNEKAFYCSELTATAINVAYPDTFPRPNDTSPMDIFLNPNFDIIDFNKILGGK